MIWERSGEAYYAVGETHLGDSRFYLVVERLPGQAWDWSVYCAGVSPEMAMSGMADTVHSAMRAAESVARRDFHTDTVPAAGI
jgi:hypothetical protein